MAEVSTIPMASPDGAQGQTGQQNQLAMPAYRHVYVEIGSEFAEFGTCKVRAHEGGQPVVFLDERSEACGVEFQVSPGEQRWFMVPTTFRGSLFLLSSDGRTLCNASLADLGTHDPEIPVVIGLRPVDLNQLLGTPMGNIRTADQEIIAIEAPPAHTLPISSQPRAASDLSESQLQQLMALFGGELQSTAIRSGVEEAMGNRNLRLLFERGTQFYFKETNGKTYIVLKGYPGLRRILHGTRYAASSLGVLAATQSIRTALGSQMTGAAMRGNALWVVPFELADAIKNDRGFLETLGGVTVAAAEGVVGGMIAAGIVATVAAGAPVAVVVGATLAIGVLVGVGIGWIDQHLGIKDGARALGAQADTILVDSTGSIIDAVSNPSETLKTVESRLSWFMNEFERQILWRASGGRFP